MLLPRYWNVATLGGLLEPLSNALVRTRLATRVVRYERFSL